MITVFGSINYDLIGAVERLPQPGETVPGYDFAAAPGGKGANQALAAARAGGSVAMVGAVGRDDNAAPALALLKAGGLDLSRVRQVSAPTGVALILVDRAGENVIAVIPGANGTLSIDDAAAIDFAPGDVLLLQLEVPVAAIEPVARRARQAGAQVLLNFAPFRGEALGLLQHATHLIVNESECDLVAGQSDVAGDTIAVRAAALAERHMMKVVVTLGSAGVMAVAEGQDVHVPAIAVDAVDTVGAGDTFCGYLAAALADRLPLDEALRWAAAAGSLACTAQGAQPSIPLRQAVDAVLKQAND